MMERDRIQSERERESNGMSACACALLMDGEMENKLID